MRRLIASTFASLDGVMQAPGDQPIAQTLNAAKKHVASRTSNSGVVMSTYVPAGEIRLGSFATTEPSEKELVRRRKLAKED